MATLNALSTTQRIADTYRRYLISTYAPRTAELRRDFENALGGTFPIANGPYLQASPPFVPGVPLRELIESGVLSPHFRELASAFPLDRPLHKHQETAIRRAVTDERNLIVATGTGSGKTECFLLPILNYLLRERDAGTLSQPGVRALLLYPMNALANDQVKRLRRLLAPFPDVTFGRYVGETARERRQAEQDFHERYPNEPRIKNELISREQMQATPPHILLTNYAMLEYLLLRPDDSPLFDGPHAGRWRFVVLDEAHVYDGAQGTELAMLLRRVKDRVLHGAGGRLQCFATSATLGGGKGDYPALLEFAERLFDAPFEWRDDDPGRQDIVEAEKLPLQRSEVGHRLPVGTLQDLCVAYRSDPEGCTEALVACIERGGVTVDSSSRSLSPQAFLARALAGDERVVRLQARLEAGTTPFDRLAQMLFDDIATGLDEQRSALVDLIDLCVVARHRAEDAPLVPARYHYFVRALEGAFVCLHPQHDASAPRVLLHRHERCPSCDSRRIRAFMFELATCRRCRAEYVVGDEGEEAGQVVLAQAQRFSRNRQILLLGRATDSDDDDEGATGVEVASEDADTVYHLCPGCGALLENAGASCSCESRPARQVVTVAKPSKTSGLVQRCPACASRSDGEIVTRFESGSDAPVAVVATALYQQIPPADDPTQQHFVGEGRKLLAFADSRQDAAFFAPYLERTYSRAVRRRLISDAISRLTARDGEPPRFEDLIHEVRRTAEESRVLDPDASATTKRREVATWLMHEVLSFDRRANLEGCGIASITPALSRTFAPPAALLSLGFTESEATALLEILLRTLRESGAVTVPDEVDIRDAAFAPRNRDLGMREFGSDVGVLAWMPGDHTTNRRADYLERLFKAKAISADPREVLKNIWRYLTTSPDFRQVLVTTTTKQHGSLTRLSYERFQFDPLTSDHRPYRCSRCRQLTWESVAGVCPAIRCDGQLEPVEDLDALLADHYARLYRDTAKIGMSVQEHTAQYAAPEASKIQSRFIEGAVNVLSCSTTFEMGVDVGDVQAVLLRNVPPSPANYVQRAGRAGRRTDSAALVTTFAQRRSHDLTFFREPFAMIDGKVAPPRILLENASIARRHVHSVAFAIFEREAGGHTTVDSFFLAPEGATSAADDFGAWLRAEPPELRDALKRIVPAEVSDAIGVESWAWASALLATDASDPTHGWFERATEEVREDLGQLDGFIAEASNQSKFDEAARLQRLRHTLGGRPLLGFLASRNVLPKYGFPVDVVSLDVSKSGDADAAKLDLTRDLAIAVSDYAPGTQTIAAKAAWQSVGLVTRRNNAWPTYKWAVCRDCGRFRHALEDLPAACPACGSAEPTQMHGIFAVPMFGFLGRKHGSAGDTRPLRSTVVHTYFGSYKGNDPAWIVAQSVSSRRVVRTRVSRQGKITIVNTGPAGRGYRICDWCGHGEPAPAAKPPGARASRPARPTEHDDPRMPGRRCKGTLQHRHLGHEFLTDTLEIDFGCSMEEPEARSVLSALLASVRALDIEPNDVGGTLNYLDGGARSLVLYDAVPGGAGHARRMSEHLQTLFEAALLRAEQCQCGEETSCYNCLRNYRNQLWHDVLRRGDAIRILEDTLGGEVQRDLVVLDPQAEAALALLHDSVRPLVSAVVRLGAPMPVAQYEIAGPDTQWASAVAWPAKKVAIMFDDHHPNDERLAKVGWTALPLRSWTKSRLYTAVI